MPFDLLVRNTSEVVTVQGGPSEPAERALAPIPRGALGVKDGRIAFLGPQAALPPDAVGPGTALLDAAGGFLGPALVDPHTHLVFAGERAEEFELRNQGASYLEIARAGGGIMSTVRATRASSEEELIALALPRLERLLAQGVLWAEVKSGYGLTLEDELKTLRVIRRLSQLQPVRLVPTLLCAHAVPEEMKSARERYLTLCVEEIIPQVAAQGLARSCDAFVEEGAFTPEEARRILTAAKDAGLALRLHVDQLTSGGGAELAAELHASSADHLERISDAGIAALASSGVSAVLAPISTLFLKVRPYAPGRKLRDAGVNVALCTNLNPGSAMTENVALAMGLACLENGLSSAEAYFGFTRGAALALGLPEAGQLVPGGPADFVLFSCESPRHLPYHLAASHVRAVAREGQLVYQQSLSAC